MMRLLRRLRRRLTGCPGPGACFKTGQWDANCSHRPEVSP